MKTIAFNYKELVISFLFLLNSLSACTNNNTTSESNTTISAESDRTIDEITNNRSAIDSNIVLNVDGHTYYGVKSTIQGWKTFSAGVYQIVISATFNSAPPPIRSISFVLWDDDAASESHIKTFPVATTQPYGSANYNFSIGLNEWTTHTGTGSALAIVGSGAFVVTKYDKTNKLFSGTFNHILKKPTSSKTITGSFTNIPIQRAD